MGQDRSQMVAAVRAYCAAHPRWVLFDEPTQTLLEVATGKSLLLPAAEMTQAVARTNSQTGHPYLLIELGDGRELALCDAGIAFPPVAPAVPQAPEMPPVTCLSDFAQLTSHLSHLLYGHPDDKPGRETLDIVAVCLGILDGARRVGFDISREEKQLDQLLEELEKRK